jgi:hypothetical protein
LVLFYSAGGEKDARQQYYLTDFAYRHGFSPERKLPHR